MSQIEGLQGQQTPYNIIVSDICSDLSYFQVVCHPHKEKQEGPPASTIITYRKDTVPFKELMVKYRQNNPQDKRENLSFYLSQGFQIPEEQTVRELKKQLRRPNINGVVLFTDMNQEVESHIENQENASSQSQTSISDECGLMQLIQSEPLFQTDYVFTFYFIIPKTLHVITATLRPEDNTSLLVEQFFTQMLHEFKVSLTHKDINKFMIRNSKRQLNTKICLKDHKELHDNSEIQVVFDVDIKLVRSLSECYILSIRGLRKQAVVHLNYYEVRNMTLKYIFKRYFEESHQKQYNQNNRVCLKVMDIIIKPDEKLIKLQNAIHKLREIGNVKLIGHLINEKMLFYSSINFLSDVKPFQISELIIPASSNYERKQCQKKINQRLQEMQDNYFKVEKHIQPIMIYTSNLKYEDQQTKELNTIYDALNKFLREDSILHKQMEELKSCWIYRYASTLLKHLDMLDSIKGKMYRGVNYDLQQQQGESILFKSFVSTSTDMKVALRFALKNIAQNPNYDKNLYIMTVQRGKPIAKLSYFNRQQEYLLEPYTQFIITKVYHQKFRHPDLGADGQEYDFKVYEMEEIQSARTMPKTTNNYILWVDDKENQGKEIFNKFIKEFEQSTALFQIISTKELAKWIKQREVIIKDTSSNIIMITNMVRLQNGVKNFYAGVEAIQLIRTVLPNIPIAVYVRDAPASYNNLQERKVDLQNLKVIHQFEQFTKYVQNHIKVKFVDLLKKFSAKMVGPQVNKMSDPVAEKCIPKEGLKGKVEKGKVEKEGKQGSKCEIM